jgi:predicted chitinase
MFPGYPNASGKIVGKLRTSDEAKTYVAGGFTSLIEEMDKAQINTPSRVAAFLTTLCFESWIEYEQVDGTYGTRPYAGRGFIQLTREENYVAAGKALSVDLASHPDLAMTLDWSAKIATWYWTKARPRCNEYADTHQMGKVNAAIGYPLSGSNDTDRCMVFGKALKYLTGVEPTDISCTR